MGNDLLKDTVDSNQVRLFFFRGDFGGTDKIALVIKSGLKVPLKYTAKIKVDGSDQFIITDVEPLFPNVKSVEEWQDNIVEIILGNFSESSM